MTTELQQHEDVLVSLNRHELHSLLDLDPVPGPVDDSIRVDMKLARIPRPEPGAVTDESFLTELLAHEDALFSWLRAAPENGKAFITDPSAAFRTATGASAEFLERLKSPGKGALAEASLPPDAAVQSSDTWRTFLSPATSDAISVLDTGDYLYAGSNGWIYKLRTADGALLLTRPIAKHQVNLAISGDGRKLFIGSAGQAACVNTSDFSPVWHKEIDSHGEIVHLLLSGTTLYAGTRGHAMQLNYDTGTVMVLNELKGRGDHEVRLALAEDKSLLFVGTDGYALALNTHDLAHKAIWQTSLDHTGTDPITILTRGRDIYAAGNGRLFKLRFDGTVDKNNILKDRGDHDVRMEFSPDGRSLLLGTSGYALSIDAVSLETIWQTNLLDESGTAVSVLPHGDVLYAGNCGHSLRLIIATGVVTSKQDLGGGGKQEIGMALSPDGAHLRLACNGFVAQTPAAGDLAAGWQAIAAMLPDRVNATLASLFGSDARTIKSPFTLRGKDYDADVSIGPAPQIIGGGDGRVIVAVALTGTITPAGDGLKPAMKLDGHVELTVDLKTIQARVEDENAQGFVLAVDLGGGALFDAIDLSHLHLAAGKLNLPLSDLAPVLLAAINAAVRRIPSPVRIPVQKALPVSLTGLVVRFAYTPVAGAPARDFLSVLFGLAGNEGSFNLSPSIIGYGADTDTAFVFGNRAVMETIKGRLSEAPGGSAYGFEVSHAYPAVVSNAKQVPFNDVPGVWLKIDKRYVQSFIDGKLENNVSVSYMNVATLGIWHAVHVVSSTRFTAENGNIRLTFVAELNVPWTFFLNIFTVIMLPLMIALKKLIPNLVDGKGDALIVVPGFDVRSVSTPAYVQITGRPTA